MKFGRTVLVRSTKAEQRVCLEAMSVNLHSSCPPEPLSSSPMLSLPTCRQFRIVDLVARSIRIVTIAASCSCSTCHLENQSLPEEITGSTYSYSPSAPKSSFLPMHSPLRQNHQQRFILLLEFWQSTSFYGTLAS